jgi:uncharacterized protein YcaQ
MQKISLALARQITLRAQGLYTSPCWPAGREGTARVIEQLGYVQIDSISVIQRAHQHTLWTRVPGYDPTHLDELLARDRRIFEYWRGSGVSYLPMADYRFYRYLMDHHAHGERMRDWLASNQALTEFVLGRLRDEGSLASVDFEAPEGFIRGTWWSRKPAKVALEMLLDIGQVMVDRRDHFTRVYTLTERVLPQHVNLIKPNADDMSDFSVLRALDSLGIITAVESAWGLVDKVHAAKALGKLVESGQVSAVSVETLEDETYYVLRDLLENEPVVMQPELRLLAPFDNLIIARSRLKKLFGFDYHLECYLPAEKRKVGYYNLPVLWGDRFVARLDPKAERSTRTLIVRNLVLEPGVDVEEFALPLTRRLTDLARFNGCQRVTFERSDPPNLAAFMAARAKLPRE